MPRPIVSDAAERLFGDLGPWSRADGEETEWALLTLCEGFIGQMQPILAIVEDDDDGNPGWSSVMDADRAPIEWLPWLAQFVGARMIPGLTEAAMRLRIKGTDGFKRGTPDAIRAAARQFSIGPDGTPDSATVVLIERNGSAYRLTLLVREEEVESTADVQRAVLEQKPSGIILDIVVTPSLPDYEFISTLGTYADLPLDYYDYSDMITRRAVAYLASYAVISARYPDYSTVTATDATYEILRKEHI